MPCHPIWPRYTSLACRKEERRAQLAKAAEDMKSSGKAEAAFEDSGYSVGEGELADLRIYFLMLCMLCR